MKSVLVTGANGLLGTNVVLELLGRGYAVKGLVRSRRRSILSWNWSPEMSGMFLRCRLQSKDVTL